MGNFSAMLKISVLVDKKFRQINNCQIFHFKVFTLRVLSGRCHFY